LRSRAVDQGTAAVSALIIRTPKVSPRLASLHPVAFANRGTGRPSTHDSVSAMGFDQYHEPPEELPQETRTFARMITSLIEEAEAIGWYEQRLAVEPDRDAVAIMRNAQHEEMKHFGMDLEFLLRKKPQWRETLRGILFQKGDIVKHADEAEEHSESVDEK
jgi:uncharacterized protein